MSYVLAAKGETRALRVENTKDAEGAIIAYLYVEKDPLELEQIAGETRMDEEPCRRVLQRLVNLGYVKEV
jgi:DNA-binding IscR family transcriptional regulator